MIYGIELGMVVVALLLAFTFPYLGSRWFEAVERALAKLAGKPRLAVAVTGITALAVRAALLPILPIPNPAFHDEFCYLLAADTFAHGRLANPTHPMWIHFETHYVLWHPVYASMFPPAQGLIMAFGQAVLGHPFWGVWLSLGLMCAAITWMLQGWLPPKWSLLGGLLAVIRLATFSYWANSYWGGAVAATGGALLFGALPRLKQSLRVLDALLLALGLAILANSRPYEGLVISLPVFIALLAWMLGKNHPPLPSIFRRLVLPAGVLLGIVAIFMGYNSWRVTGSPWRMGHQSYNATHLANPYFLWQTARPVPTDHHDVTQDFYKTIELPYWQRIHTLAGLLRLEGTRVIELWAFYLLLLFTLPLIVTVATVPFGFSWGQISTGTRFLLMTVGFGLAGYALEVYFNPHYVAPGTCLVYALVLIAMRNVRNWNWRQKPVGLAITRAVPVIAGTLLMICAVGGPRSTAMAVGAVDLWCSPGASNLMSDRARILAQLQHEPGMHLVIVRYSATHQLGLDWVYNRADIDASKVVWARDMGRDQNTELLKYFHGRRIWLAEPDLMPARLSVYPAEQDLEDRNYSPKLPQFPSPSGHAMKLVTRIMENTAAYSIWQAPFAEKKFAPILAYNDLRQARWVLDVGCGPGTNTLHFAHTNYLGIDHNLRYLQHARRQHGRDFLVADITRPALAPGPRFDFILVNSFLHHIDAPGTHEILAEVEALLAEDGHVHILELVLPQRPSVAKLLARLDRGEFPRLLGEWKEIFGEIFETEIFAPYQLTGLGATLWEMIYFKGRRKR